MVDFQSEVIERSYSIPVLVDFWAPWCGPCRVLGPVLEQLAGEQQGRWKLVKVNTEDQPDLGQQYHIRSIPNVKLFIDGDITNEFAGALPKSSIERWLNENIPDEYAKEFSQILNDAEDRPSEEVIPRLKELVSNAPHLAKARILLAEKLVISDPYQALENVADIKMGEAEYDQAQYIKSLANLMLLEIDNESEVNHLINQAQIALSRSENELAIQSLIKAIQVDKEHADGLARKSAIALFNIWGSQHELTKKFRRQFDMALY